MTGAELLLLDRLGHMLSRRKQPLSVFEVAALDRSFTLRSVRTLLSNLTRPRYSSARVTYSGGIHSDGALYGPSTRIERNPWVERLDDGHYTLTEEGWYHYFRRNLIGVSDSDAALELAREYVRALANGGTGSLTSPEDGA